MEKGFYGRIRRMTEDENGTIKEGGGFEGEIGMALQGQSEILPSTEFVKVEKNLASLGFFTPSSKRLRNAHPSCGDKPEHRCIHLASKRI